MVIVIKNMYSILFWSMFKHILLNILNENQILIKGSILKIKGYFLLCYKAIQFHRYVIHKPSYHYIYGVGCLYTITHLD